jgi:gamma-glutamyltranspeptidase/glutathione hydrolase
MLNLIDFGLPVDEAVNAPRIHFEGGVLDVEAGMAPEEVDTLEAMGLRVKRWRKKDMYFGGVHTIYFNDGAMRAAGDERRGGAVAAHPSTDS